MRQVLFVQGGGGDAHDAWDNRLVESLQGHLGSGYEIRYPRMPDESDPTYGRWKVALRAETDELNDGAVLVGHSVGAVILARFLADAPPQRSLAGLFLISMPFIGEEGWPSDDIAPNPGLGAALPKQLPVYLYQGDEDKIVPARHVELNKNAMPQAMVRILIGRDHQLNNDLCEVAADIDELCA